MSEQACEQLGNKLPLWKIDPSRSKRVQIKTDLPFTLERYIDGGKGERLLIIPPIINHSWILDMRPEISVVRQFSRKGFDVYMVAWNIDQEKEIGFYSIISYLREALKKIGNASIFGYCTGGIIALLFTSFNQSLVNSISLLATPVDFSKPDMRILLIKCFDAAFFRKLFKNIPGELINAIGAALLYYHIPQFSLQREFISEMRSREVLADYWRRLRWVVETPAVPGKVYEEFIQGFYRENALVKKELLIDGHQVDLSRIDVPVLNIMAKYDHIVPVESVKALREAVSSTHYEEILFPSSHVGLSISKKAHNELWPKVAEWINKYHRRPQ